MGKIYITADTHFSHAGIICYENRPFDSAAQMDEAIVSNWNDAVKKDDTVYHLGDFAFCGEPEVRAILSRLNGAKYLVMGNHDRVHKPSWWRDAGFVEAYEHPICIMQFIWLSHEPMYMNMNMPYLNIHGHVHNNLISNPRREVYLNASVEHHSYAPFELMNAVGEKARECEKQINDYLRP